VQKNGAKPGVVQLAENVSVMDKHAVFAWSIGSPPANLPKGESCVNIL
jgi:hypothetical protein